MIPFEVPPRIDPDAAFLLCVQISQFSAKLDDGSSVDMPRRYDEWVVDYRCCTFESLLKDLAAIVKWGSCQQPIICEFDMSSCGERKLVDDKSLSLAFAERQTDKKLFLFVDVEEKPVGLGSGSVVTVVVVSNMVTDNGSAQVDASNQPNVGHVIDWNSLEIVPIGEEQIGAAVAVMDEDAMYAFVGLRAEDEKREKDRLAAEKEKEKENDAENVPIDLQGAELPVHDLIPGEDSVFYDRENPPIKVGSTYTCMDEFRAAMRQHAIKGQFELGIEKSCKDRYRGYCKAEGCAWAIVARLMPDGKQVRVLPPLAKRPIGRQRKNRIPSCLELKGNKPRTKGLWQVQCKGCLAYGHRSTSPKCTLNGTKKRKSRAKKGKPGRPADSTKGAETSTTPKRQKVTAQENLSNTSPGSITRSQMALSMADEAGTSKEVSTPTRPRTSPKKRASMKKLTPRKEKK